MQVRTPPDGPWHMCGVVQSDEAQVQVTVPLQPEGIGMQA